MSNYNEKTTLLDLYDELSAFSNKLIYLNSAKAALFKKVQEDSDFNDEKEEGLILIDCDIETELKSILTKFRESKLF